jgi:two-component system chemotaxis sensor kinase CheA
MTDAEVINLIFCSGLSTAEKVTDISGRGVGMMLCETILNA